jgi:hypothetical protein
MREAQLDRDLPRFFLGQAIGISSRECFNQRALAVIHVTSRRKNEMFLGHVSF